MDEEKDSVQSSSDTPFLSGKEFEEGLVKDQHGHRRQRRASWFQRNRNCLLSNIVVFSICVLVGIIDRHWYLSRLPSSGPQSLVYTPAQNSLEYIRVRMDTAGVAQSKYMGFDDAADRAWAELTSRSHVRLSEEDLRIVNQTSVELGSGGYLGMLAVYHELHCVKWIRWALDLDRYTEKLSAHELAELPHHIAHCVDVVRQSIMCRANTAIVTYEWNAQSRIPNTNFHGYGQCLDWERLESWVDDNIVRILEPGELNHPVYGQSFPHGHRVEEQGSPAILPAVYK